MNADLAAQKAMDRLRRDGAESLTETERILATVWLFAAGVGNGGFTRYFSSRDGNLASGAPSALRAIGALQTADIAEAANAVFSGEGPANNRVPMQGSSHDSSDAARLEFAALEQRFDQCDEDLDELLENFLAGKSLV